MFISTCVIGLQKGDNQKKNYQNYCPFSVKNKTKSDIKAPAGDTHALGSTAFYFKYS